MRSNTDREDDKKQEIYVCDVVKLVEQVLRYETQGSVFRSSDLVPIVRGCRIAIFIHELRRQWHIDKDGAWANSILVLLCTLFCAICAVVGRLKATEGGLGASRVVLLLVLLALV